MRYIIFSVLFVALVLNSVFAQETTTIKRGNLVIDLETGEKVEQTGNIDEGSIDLTGTSQKNFIDTGTVMLSGSSTGMMVTEVSQSGMQQNIIVTHDVSDASGNQQRNKTVFATGSDELLNAILRMYANGLTKFNTKTGYMSDDFLTREQMAKMVVQAYKVLGYPDKMMTGSCDFGDLDQADPTLKSFIQESCKLGILNGRDGNFHNRENLTKAQTLTILIRIFEGKKSDENVIPRWKNYVNKAKSIGLTNDPDVSNYDKPITRGQVALLFYRFKSIAENSMLTSSALQEMQSVGEDSPEKINTKTLDDSLSLLTQGISAGDDPELREAIFRLYQQGMSEYKDAEDFRAFDQIERQEAAKFLGQFHQKFLLSGNISTDIPNDCYFPDLQDADPILQPYILYTCQQGIFGGDNGRFHPTHSLLKSEFVASLVRMLGKNQTATGDVIWWKPYFDIALQLGLVSYVDRITFDKPITRYEVALILYRFRIKYKLLSNLNSATLENQIITMLKNSTKEIDGHKQGKVYITTTKLQDQNFNVGYIELFDTRYKIVKKNIEKYFSNNFVRYGEVYDMVTDKPTGTLSLIISNSTILEGNIRPELSGDVYYQILKPNETNSYYIIKEKQIEE